MKDIYRQKLSLLNIFKYSFIFVKQKWLVLLVVFSGYLAILSFFVYNVVTYVFAVASYHMTQNYQVIQEIVAGNLNDTGTFIIVRIWQGILFEVWPYCLTALMFLVLWRGMYSIWLFVMQDLFIKEKKPTISNMVVYILQRVWVFVLTDLLFIFLACFALIFYWGIYLATQFVYLEFEMIYVIGLLVFMASVCIFIYCFSYQSLSKYKQLSFEALHYSLRVIAENVFNVFVLVGVSGIVVLGGFYLGLSNILITDNLGLYQSTILYSIIIWVVVFNSFKIVKNFLFLNLDYVYREKQVADDLYLDLIDYRILHVGTVVKGKSSNKPVLAPIDEALVVETEDPIEVTDVAIEEVIEPIVETTSSMVSEQPVIENESEVVISTPIKKIDQPILAYDLAISGKPKPKTTSKAKARPAKKSAHQHISDKKMTPKTKVTGKAKTISPTSKKSTSISRKTSPKKSTNKLD